MSNKKNVPADLKDSVNKVWLAGLGALATAEDEGQKWFKTMIAKGEDYQKRGQAKLDDVKDRIEDATDKAKERAGGTFGKIEDRVDDLVNGALRRAGVPSRDEIATLTKRVEELTSLVEQMKPAAKPARKPATRKASTAKSTAKSTASKSTASKSTAAKTEKAEPATVKA